MNPRKRRAKSTVGDLHERHCWLTYSVRGEVITITRMTTGGNDVFDKEVRMSESDLALAHEAFELGVTHARMQMRAALGIGS